MRFALKNGVIPAAIGGIIAVMAFAPTDGITELLMFVLVLLLTVAALAGISRLTSVTTWRLKWQRFVVWGVALAIAFAVGLTPLCLSILRR
jgi:hypothetical protein